MWPFDFFPPNRVSWLSEGNGILFGSSGVVVSDAPLTTGSRPGSSYSLEILLRPLNVESAQTILAFYTQGNPRPFLVRQSRTELFISHGFVEFVGLDNFFRQGKLVFLAMTSGPNGTLVYKDGWQARTFSTFRILPNDLFGNIVMGSSAMYVEPWQGEVRGLAIYSRELLPAEVLRDYNNWIDGHSVANSHGATASFAFAEHAGRYIHNAVTPGPNLEIPKFFEVPSHSFLTSPAKDFEANRDYVFHLFENTVGFVPLGFLTCAYLATKRSQSRAILYSIVAAGLLSLTIEVLQAYLPQKESDVTDIMTNTLGALCGAMLARPGIVRIFLDKTKLRAKTAEKLSA